MDDTNQGLDHLLQDIDEPQGVTPQRMARTTVARSSVRLNPERCVGCAACMRVCPTEAIRIRNGMAVVKSQLCIDCGECVRVCEHKAWIVSADPISSIHQYDYRIAIPEPSIYGQFIPSILPGDIHSGILEMGFQEVYGAALATERVGRLLRVYMQQYKGPKPLITSFCPVVVRLIQLRFPELIDLVVPVDSALELAVRELKEQRSTQLGIPLERIGAFYLAGCPARITTIHHPYTGGKTYVDGAFSIGDIYRELMFAIRRNQKSGVRSEHLRKCPGAGIRWGALGGAVEALGMEHAIAVSEMKHLVRVVEEIDNHKLSDIDFVECRACYGGCAGGPLLADNPYRGRAKIQMLSRRFDGESACEIAWIQENFERYKTHFDRRLAPLPADSLDPDPSRAIEKLALRAKIQESLPGIDCGSCGAPNCRALADDIVRGEANSMYCIFKLRDAFLRQKRNRRKDA